MDELVADVKWGKVDRFTVSNVVSERDKAISHEEIKWV